MVRTNQHEIENQPGVSFLDCFKGSDRRRTEIAVVGWAVQVLSGSSFGNQGTYFFQQGKLISLRLGQGLPPLSWSEHCRLFQIQSWHVRAWVLRNSGILGDNDCEILGITREPPCAGS
jgi:hypothetical protein